MIDTDGIAKHNFPAEQTRMRAPTPAPSPRGPQGTLLPFVEDECHPHLRTEDFDSSEEDFRSSTFDLDSTTATHRPTSSKVRFDETPVVIANFRNDSDPSSDFLEDDFDEEKQMSKNVYSYLQYHKSGISPEDDFDDSDSESVTSDITELYEYPDLPSEGQNTRISWGPNVHLGARIQHERKRSNAFRGTEDITKSKISNTLSTKDFDNLTKHNKLLRIYGISSAEIKLLKGRRKAANKLGCIPMNVFDGPARSPRLSATPLKSALKPKRELLPEELRHRAFLLRKIAYEARSVSNIAKGDCLIKYGPRGKPTKRWFCLSNDHSELHWGHSAKRKKKRKLALGDLIDVIPGKGFARFKSSTVPPWLCITLAFTTRHLHLSCPNIASFMDWFLGLQSLAPLSSCNMTRGMLMWYRAIWKLDQQAAGIAQVRSEWVYPNEEPQRSTSGTMSNRKKRHAKLSKITW